MTAVELETTKEAARIRVYAEVHALALRRWKVALALTFAMVAVYFSFVLGVAFDKVSLGAELVPGLSLGMVLGASVIVVAFALTAIYARWANRKYDVELDRILAARDGGAS